MAHLFHRAGIPFALAHVHYGLRGEESLEDMIFVEALARTLHVPFHCSDASANMRNVLKAEIQQAARAWRYRVFGELCHEHGYR
ncbi:MAG: tRNA(Ile)-lysidine synthetase, partial [Bacteroidetes bacterium]|nr:tRNA(Ile)-lysidine synthetase [Bacteroidota bacterium]